VRVIEPNQLQRRSIKKKKQSPVVFVVVFLVVALLYGAWVMAGPKKIDSNTNVVTNSVGTPKTDVPIDPVKKTTLRQFTNKQFVEFYSNFAYPNTAEIVIPPVITGNAEADIKIQALAEERGYKLRSAPISGPIKTVSDYYIQQKAAQSLTDMFAEGKKQNLTFTLTAAFRSVDEQRDLFLERLNASYSDIAAGKADAQVNETLKVTAPPGYSRHHNGFTIDIACGDIGGLALLQTTCYTWLSKDNFKNAKEFGWIPSYPDGATSVGPEPEPWELVWVGRDALLE